MSTDKKEKTERTTNKILEFKAVKTGGLKIEFIKSPTGLFKLGYSAGDKESFEKKQAEILIDAGVAKKV